jgi:hypothetical protein
MWLAAVLIVIAVAWLLANARYLSTNRWADRRRRAAFSWAGVGAVIGSGIGIAGFGDAIAGTIPCAFVGYVLASSLMKVDRDEASPPHATDHGRFIAKWSDDVLDRTRSILRAVARGESAPPSPEPTPTRTDGVGRVVFTFLALVMFAGLALILWAHTTPPTTGAIEEPSFDERSPHDDWGREEERAADSSFDERNPHDDWGDEDDDPAERARADLEEMTYDSDRQVSRECTGFREYVPATGKCCERAGSTWRDCVEPIAAERAVRCVYTTVMTDAEIAACKKRAAR